MFNCVIETGDYYGLRLSNQLRSAGSTLISLHIIHISTLVGDAPSKQSAESPSCTVSVSNVECLLNGV